MTTTNEWASFGLDEPDRPKRKFRRGNRIDTSRMSWHNCHVGYAILVIVCFLLTYWFDVAFLVGIVAMLNASYALVFTQRPRGSYSSPIWWIALITSVILFCLFAVLEISAGLDNGVKIVDLIALALVSKLTIGQLVYLYGIRRERRMLLETAGA
jgi:hypothetical protein